MLILQDDEFKETIDCQFSKTKYRKKHNSIDHEEKMNESLKVDEGKKDHENSSTKFDRGM